MMSNKIWVYKRRGNLVNIKRIVLALWFLADHIPFRLRKRHVTMILGVENNLAVTAEIDLRRQSRAF